MFHLAWRNLLQSRTQFFLGVGGVALALLLMLSLDALLAGSEQDLVAYIYESGADIFVAQEGVRNLHMAASAISVQDMRRAARVEGVASASPILYTTGVVETEGADILSYIIGFDPRKPLGGPQTVVAGTARPRQGEAIIDDAVARSQGVELGDEIEILGKTFTVVGLTKGLTNIINSVTFIHIDDFRALRRGDSISYALLAVEPGYDPAEVAAAIEARDEGVTALPREVFAREERQIIKDMSVEVIYIMNLAGLLIGLAVTALTLYTATLRKRQEYGVLKAMGAQNRHLYSVVAVQAFLSLTMGAAVAIGLVWVMGQILPLVVPGTAMALTRAGVVRVLTAALGIGVVAALAPAWQIARLDPAQVFRG